MRFDIPFLVYDMADFQLPEGKPKFLTIVKSALHRAHIRTRCAESQGWRCCYCHKEMNLENGHRNSITLEHVNPVSKGGSDEYENSAAACKRCNNNRGNLPLDDDGKYTIPPKESKELTEGRRNKLLGQAVKRAVQIQSEGGNVQGWVANIKFIMNDPTTLEKFWECVNNSIDNESRID